MNELNDALFDIPVPLYNVNQPVRRPIRIVRRADHVFEMPDAEFKRTFRFDKASVAFIVDLLRDQLHHVNNRGRPLTPEQQVCLALNHYAGGQFQRTTGLCGGVCQATAWKSIHTVTDALCGLKRQFIRMPTEEEMYNTSQRIADRYRIL